MADFDRIAEDWYNKRHYSIFQDELSGLSNAWVRGKLLNIGCGHGADFLMFRKFSLFGLDNSVEMLNNAKKYGKKFAISETLILGDASSLPLKDGYFDNAIAIAVFHHLRAEGRGKAFAELFRVLRKGGEAFVTVWNKTQPRFLLSKKEVNVPWAAGKADRYYYLFDYGEITNLAKKSGFQVLKAFPEKKHRIPIRELSRNICLLLRKP